MNPNQAATEHLRAVRAHERAMVEYAHRKEQAAVTLQKMREAHEAVGAAEQAIRKAVLGQHK